VRPALDYLRAFLKPRLGEHGTQRDLAVDSGLSPGYLNDIAGVRRPRARKKKAANPTLKKVDQIAGALDVPVSAIFSEAVFADDSERTNVTWSDPSIADTQRATPPGKGEPKDMPRPSPRS
jgi:transcriptional regulator with XRE-family HTH domain